MWDIIPPELDHDSHIDCRKGDPSGQLPFSVIIDLIS